MARVLIVDDSITVRMDLLELFEHEGWSPTPCATLAEARAALAAGAFDLVVLDVLLPDGDGIDLLRQIRQAPRSRAWPVMVLSGEDEVADRLRGLEMGADEYVGKPYDRTYVIACAARYLRGARQPDGAPTVLLVDDSQTYLETMRAAFTDAGFRVVAVPSGEDGLRVAATQSIDAAVVDLHLPGIDGVALIRRLRADRGLQLMPCMLLTGSELQTDELMGLEAGADAYLAKVHDPEVIVARLSALLRSVGARPDVGFDPVGPKKILAVDDSVTYLHALSDRLRHEGYGVVITQSGAEAMAVLGAETVDLVLLDVIMPGLSGIEVCRRLKANASWQDVPVILLTAREEREAMLEGLNAGADDYVVKGTDFDVLTGRVRAHLRRKHLQDENRRIHERLHRMRVEAQEERAARELAETRAALMEDLEAKNAELVQARARAEQESRYKSQFLACMSHELRTPLNSIIGFSELLEQELFGPLNERQARYVTNVLDSGRHLLSLVNDILDLSKIEAGRMTLDRDWTALTTIVDAVAGIVRSLSTQRSIQLVLDVEPELPEIFVDPLRVKQILYNLLSNAIKFTPPHGTVTLTTRRAGGHLTIEVADTGVGIRAQDLPRLFREFEQIEPEEGQKPEGTGLGLALTQRLVAMHGGHIEVESIFGEGSIFRIHLPLRDPDHAPGLAAEATDGPRPLVLVVDDDARHCELMGTVLDRAGYRVAVAHSAADAIRLAESLRPAAITLDMALPDGDGWGVLRKLEASPITGGTPIIGVSARDQPAQSQLLGATDYLVKPVSGDAIVQSLTLAGVPPCPGGAPAAGSRHARGDDGRGP